MPIYDLRYPNIEFYIYYEDGFYKVDCLGVVGVSETVYEAIEYSYRYAVNNGLI